MAQADRQSLTRRWWAPIAVAMVGLAHLLRLMALMDLGHAHPFVTFYLAVIASAVLGGGRAGLLATALSAVVADYFWVPPFHSLGLFEKGDGLAMLAFVGGGMMISGLAGQLGQIQDRLKRAEAAEKASLEAKIAAIAADLTRNQRRFTAALFNSRVSVWEQDTALRYTWMWNPRLGYALPDIIGKTDAELMDPACLAELEAFKHGVIADGHGRQKEIAIGAPGGPVEWFDLYAEVIREQDGRIVGITCVAIQITERVALEQELRRLTTSLEMRVQSEVAAREGAQQRAAQAERMQALGRLAGGIAHDLNNVLQSIDGGAALIHKRADNAAEVRALSARVMEAVDRGAATTRRLLTFSRGGDLTAQPIDPAGLIDGVAAILRDTLGPNVRVEVRRGADLAPILADRAQLETVLLNLGANARDAMPDGGVLTLAADLSPAQGEGDVMIRLSVIDTGVGMDEATLARATEPLFTTKAHGRGTGLGLALARTFAEQSGGDLTLESAPGAGTTVSLWLPRAAGLETPAWVASEAAGRVMTGRVVLVDDEAFVRETLAAALREAGFTVEESAGPDHALAIIADDEGRKIDALVSDLSMPGDIDGLSLIRSAWRYSPGLPAVLLTGHLGAEAEASLDMATRVGISLIRKPTSGRELADHIATLIAAKRNGK